MADQKSHQDLDKNYIGKKQQFDIDDKDIGHENSDSDDKHTEVYNLTSN
jgi:hypothetical protein